MKFIFYIFYVLTLLFYCLLLMIYKSKEHY